MVALGRWLSDERRAVGLTNDRLGARIGYHGTTVSRACNGKAVPSWALVSAIVVACHGDVGLARRLWEDAVQAQRVRRNQRIRREPIGRIDSFDGLSAGLRQMWLDTGLSQRAIVHADESGRLRRSSLGAVLRGERRPHKELTAALTRACGGDEQTVAVWVQVWEQLDADHQRARYSALLAARERRRHYFRSRTAFRRP
ncbi:hypothetical protein BBK82_14340 [Lentzea guizhouensis]|uniref:Uncharacterized protein n=1 Tax=Lentzea guizhouensis TaxID=1586287 RepID=A0A1B2HH98_9PSEU|nr:helix-turn-helix transcriptional regulator [Lentzea guizhouensis]ANZ37070.1 hypothetical protein BBK82_14340 [Lentzea guizhouensis]